VSKALRSLAESLGTTAFAENQTEDDEAALVADDTTLLAFPKELVPEVRALQARKHSA